MKTWIKVCIGFVAGATAGALVTHLYYKETIQNTIDRRVFEIVGKPPKPETKKEINVEAIKDTYLPEQPPELDLKSFSSGKVDYTGFYDNPSTVEELEEMLTHPSEDDSYHEDDQAGLYLTKEHEELLKKGPRIADPSELQQPSNYVLRQMFYYPDDNALANMENGEEVEDMHALVGDLLTLSGFDNPDTRFESNMILIANDSLGEYYEIIKAV